MLRVINLIPIILLFVIATACNERETSITIDDNKVVFSDFLDVPEKLFLNIETDSSLSENYLLIGEHGFTRFNEFIHLRSGDSTFILFEESNNVDAFKVYFKSQYYLDQKELLYDFLNQRSQSAIGCYEFGQMNFSNAQTPFKLTFFSTDDFIRLSFKTISNKH